MKIMCPPDMLEMDSCPTCAAVPKDDETEECSAYIECQPVQCSWECYNPGAPRQPDCRGQCEKPACELLSPGSRLSIF